VKESVEKRSTLTKILEKEDVSAHFCVYDLDQWSILEWRCYLSLIYPIRTRYREESFWSTEYYGVPRTGDIRMEHLRTLEHLGTL
jgi:hypothetical protein